ncbi:4816_t:CDS:10 [Ambispora leptoticha]|uniref:4816_t:CDS:1 n=1 Tax=Ambispora leptoticha TaxID=144679 RepID=A0A9N9BCS8_9GLOM|nr:4816_t:CDS:10 [Ambispora leptoticha]
MTNDSFISLEHGVFCQTEHFKLKTIIQNLEFENKKLREHCDLLELKCELIDREKNEKVKQNRSQEIKLITQEFDILECKIKKYAEELVDTKHEQIILERQLQQLELQNSEQNCIINRATKEINRLISIILKLEESEAAFRDENHNQKLQIQRLKDNIAVFDSELTHFKESKDSETNVKSLVSSNNLLREQISENKHEIEMLSSMISSFERSKASLTEGNHQKQIIINDLQGKLVSLNTELQNLTRKEKTSSSRKKNWEWLFNPTLSPLEKANHFFRLRNEYLKANDTSQLDENKIPIEQYVEYLGKEYKTMDAFLSNLNLSIQSLSLKNNRFGDEKKKPNFIHNKLLNPNDNKSLKSNASEIDKATILELAGRRFSFQ